MDKSVEFKDKLKKLRESKGISQSRLAADIFVSRSAVAKWENGLGLPAEDSIEKLCEYFGVDKDFLVADGATENVLVEKNRKLVRQKNIIIIILSIFLAALIVFLAVEFFSLAYSDYNPFVTKVINNIKYTRVNDGTDIYYRVDGVHRDADTSNAIENLTLEDSIDGTYVRVIAPYAFEGISFGEIVLNDSLEEIGEAAFMRADAQSISFGSRLEQIGDYAFAYSNIKYIGIPNSVTSLGGAVFSGCSAEEIVLGEGINDVPSYTFELCRFLGKITVCGPAILRMHAITFCAVSQITFLCDDIMLADYALCDNPRLGYIKFVGQSSLFLDEFTPRQLGVSSFNLMGEGEEDFSSYFYSPESGAWSGR